MAAGGECDDLESWEEMEDSGVLDKKLEELKAAMSTSIQKDFRSGVTESGKNDAVVFVAEDGRTRYVPPEPTVKILKRPSMVNNSHNAGGDGFIMNGDALTKPKQPIKTLQQREIEYAEARLRILGEAQSPDERPALLERIRKIQNKTEYIQEPMAATVEACGNIMQTPPPCAAAPYVPALSPSPAMMSPQPMIIMTSASTQLPPMVSLSQTHMLKNCGNIGQYNVITAHAGFNNGCNKIGGHYPVGYNSTPNKGAVYNNVMHNHQPSHPAGYANAYTMCGGTGAPAAVYAGAGIINTSIVSPAGNNFVAIQAPISLNLAVRQPRGPDGTKGFNNYRTTLR